MDILFLTHTFPYPLSDGVRLHVYHLLKHLALRHRVSLLSLIQKDSEKEYLPQLQGLGVHSIETVRHPVPRSPWRRARNLLLEKEPFYVLQFYSPELARTLRRRIREDPPQVLHVDYLSMALYRPHFSHLPAVLFPHDAVSMLYERNAAAETNALRRTYTWAQWRKTVCFEKETIPKFEVTLVVSPVDRGHLLRLCPEADIRVAPNGVDADFFCPQEIAEKKNSVLFRGNLNFLPNHDAAWFFYHEVLPEIRRLLPGVQFYLAGAGAFACWRRLAAKDSRLILTGFVEDLRPWMAQAPVIVCPMRIGSGIKNKILEPMAMGKAVVATPKSLAAIEATDGEHLLIADSAEAFAAQTIRLLKDPALRKRLGENARKFVLTHHTWEKNAQEFEKAYRDAVKKKEDAPRPACGTRLRSGSAGSTRPWGPACGQRYTASFGFEWRRFEVQNPKEDEEVFRAKTGWQPEELRGKLVLDAGCGSGRYSAVAARWGGEVTAMDMSLAVEKAQENRRGLNISIVQADLLRPPMEKEAFDFIFSIGVLHHTPSTRQAFRAIARLLKPGGRLAIWVYRKNTRPQETLNQMLRFFTARLPIPVLLRLCYLPALLGGIPVLSLVLGRILNLGSTHPDFKMRLCDAFDWYSPKYQHHHTEAEVIRWFGEEGFSDIRILAPQKKSPLYLWVYRNNLIIGSGVNLSGRKRI